MAEKLEMRELNGGDIFAMLGIIGKLDIKEEVVSLIERQYGNDKDVISLSDHKKKKLTKKELVYLLISTWKPRHRFLRLLSSRSAVIQ